MLVHDTRRYSDENPKRLTQVRFRQNVCTMGTGLAHPCLRKSCPSRSALQLCGLPPRSAQHLHALHRCAHDHVGCRHLAGARAVGLLAGVPLSLALLAATAAAVYYCRLDLRYGLFMTALLATMLALAIPIAAQSSALWLAWGLGLFGVGWVIQFIGHYYEGRKPAFLTM